jgi:translation initiation factor 3 subunit M
VHALLTVFLTGQLADYLAFHTKQAGVVSGLGLSHEDCVAKMRLASLAALGADGASEGVITYAQVQAALQIEPAEVEAWVVRAIGAGVLEAKMDQVRRTVLITRSLHRVFGPQQWAELAAKLRSYSDNIAGALATTPPPAALEISA